MHPNGNKTNIIAECDPVLASRIRNTGVNAVNIWTNSTRKFYKPIRHLIECYLSLRLIKIKTDLLSSGTITRTRVIWDVLFFRATLPPMFPVLPVIMLHQQRQNLQVLRGKSLIDYFPVLPPTAYFPPRRSSAFFQTYHFLSLPRVWEAIEPGIFDDHDMMLTWWWWHGAWVWVTSRQLWRTHGQIITIGQISSLQY